MTDLYAMFATDQKAETEGFVHHITDTITFTLARAGGSNTKFTEVMEQKTRPYRRQIADDTMDNKLAEKLLKEAFAETVIFGWEGVTDSKKKPVPYNPETAVVDAVKLFDDLPDLFTELREAAAKQSNFRKEEIKDDVGN